MTRLESCAGPVGWPRYGPPVPSLVVRIGILSDTHDRVHAAAAAIELLQNHQAEFFIHCGDVGSEAILDCLASLPAAFVWGNNDWDRRPLERYAAILGLQCMGDFGELDLGGKRFAILHGDDTRAMRRVLTEQRHQYLLHGHTHVPRDEQAGLVRIINPGALHRAKEKTVAILNTVDGSLEFYPVRGV